MIEVEALKVAYEERVIIKNLSLKVNRGEVVSIIGPNGCGKSTLLKSLVHMIKPLEGKVYIQQQDIKMTSTKELAKKVALLSQHNDTPGGITVKELIYYGRLPHKRWYETHKSEDEGIIRWALIHTGLEGYEERQVSELSGGEQQRVWLAMALTQKTDILLLDEPTTYLDISHQLELMELVRSINEKLNITIVMVLHDLNQASQYSDRLIVMKDGQIKADGIPNKVINKQLLEDVYNIHCDIDINPKTKKPRIHPLMTCKDKCPYKEKLKIVN